MNVSSFAENYFAFFIITSSIMDVIVKSNPKKFEDGSDFMRLTFKLFCGVFWPIIWAYFLFCIFFNPFEENE